MRSSFDVITGTDCRLPGGTAVSTAEELLVQHRAGLRSGLIHLDSPLVSRTRPLNPRLRAAVAGGEADLLLPNQTAEAPLLVLRHPKVALGLASAPLPRLDVERCVVLANQVPIVDEVVVYRADEVNTVIERVLGITPMWAPIGPLVREEFAAAEPEQILMDEDWVNIIDVDAWTSDRHPPDPARIRIGRHSRDHRLKWPATRSELLQAYPDVDDVVVNVLGGVPQLMAVLGGAVPDHWNLHPFGSRAVRDFLTELDVYVYFHHHELTEAFGRNLLEAMASGVPVVTDEKFRPLFGDSVRYATPDTSLETVRSLARDPAAYLEASARGEAFVRSNFGHEQHVRRLSTLLGREDAVTLRRPPHTETETETKPETAEPATILFVGPNGAGMGHLARLMAMARRLSDGMAAHFFTFSAAASIVEREGFVVDYAPSRPVTSSSSAGWHKALAARFSDVLDEVQPVAVVIDGTEPYRGLLQALASRPGIPVVWSRRGMWRPGVTNGVLDVGEDYFDLIVEPGESARELDTGATRRSSRAELMEPVTLLGSDDLLSRDIARKELGLPPDAVCGLVTLGAGNINDTDSIVEVALETISAGGDIHVVVTNSPIASRRQGTGAAVTSVSVFPLAKYMRAFDFAVAASGYNSFHELLIAQVPTVFFPNDSTITDDQRARATWADRAGLALCAAGDRPDDVRAVLHRLLDPDERRRIATALGAQEWNDGAAQAIHRIETLARSRDVADDAQTEARRRDALAAIEAAARRPVAPSAGESSDRRAKFTPITSTRRFAVARARSAIVATRGLIGDHRAGVLLAAAPRPVRVRVRRLVTGSSRPLPKRAKKSALLRVPPGVLIPDEQEARLTPILLDLRDGVDAGRVVEAVARRQAVERTFAPLFLTSALDAAPHVRRFGFVWEHVRSRSSDERHAAWVDRRRRRLSQVRRWYRPALVVTVTSLADVTDDESLFACAVRDLDPT